MTIRLYDSAWVILRDIDAPQQVRRDPTNPGLFHVAAYKYDLDGRAYLAGEPAPAIEHILNIAEVRELGLPADYLRASKGYNF